MEETSNHREGEPNPPTPLEHEELRAAFINPIRAIEIVLADPARFASTLGAEGVLTAYYGNPRQVYLTVGLNFR